MISPQNSVANRHREFNEELGRRLAALDRGEQLKPEDVRARLQRKSEERRTKGRERVRSQN